VGTRCADHVTPLYPQKLALTSPTGGGRSVGTVRVRTKATEFRLVYTTGEKEKRTSKKTWIKGVQAAMTTRNLEPDQWRNREELRLVSGRRQQLLKSRRDR